VNNGEALSTGPIELGMTGAEGKVVGVAVGLVDVAVCGAGGGAVSDESDLRGSSWAGCFSESRRSVSRVNAEALLTAGAKSANADAAMPPR